MEVRSLAVGDPGLTDWHDAFRRGWLHERPWEHVPPLEHYVSLFAGTQSHEANEPFAAYDGERLIGAGWLTLRQTGNPENVQFVVTVAAEHRRRGAGTALVEHAVRRAAEAGRTYAVTMSSYPLEERGTNGVHRFADQVGFALDIDSVHRRLRLPVSQDLLRHLGDTAAEHHGDYRILTWVDHVPDEYVDSWLHVHNLLTLDAPQGVVPWEADALDRTGLEERVEHFAGTGRTLISSVAVSGNDEVVAFSDLVLRGDGSDQVSQEGTVVRRDHRGHRLGTAVKVANLVTLQRDHPGCTEVHTTNAEANAAMIGINEVLGFEAVAVHPCFYRKVR